MNELESGARESTEDLVSSTASQRLAPNLPAEIFSWGLILAIVALLFGSHWIEQNKPVEPDPTRLASSYPEVNAVELQTRLGIAARNVGGAGEVAGTANGFGLSLDGNSGPLWERYATTVAIAELQSPEKALENLAAIDKSVAAAGFSPDEQQVAVRNALEKTLQARVATGGQPVSDSMAKTDVETLRSKLGWLGEVATTPREEGTARPGIDDRSERLLLVLMGVGLVVVLVFLASLVSFAVATWMIAKGKIRPQMEPQRSSGSVYIETFAIWMILFLLLPSLAVGFLPIRDELAGMIGLIATLSAVGWPLVRGRSLQAIRNDLGLELRNPFVEIACGLFGWLCTLVLLGFSLVLVVPIFLLTKAAPGNDLASRAPLHPIQESLMSGNPETIVIMFLLAAVLAPLLEEIVFRGVLFRYLRDRSGHLAAWKSVLLSILVSGLIFALIHPQNLVGLIPLTVLATGMALLRHWRSSLVASMTMHAINNGFITCLMLLMLG